MTIKDFNGQEITPRWWDHPKQTRFCYNVDITSDCGIHECLGEIKPRKSDNRFDWWRNKTRFYKGQWSGRAQGVADSVENAKLAIEKGWLAGENKSG